VCNLTNDPHLKTAASIRLAVVYSNLKRPVQRLHAYEQAIQYSESTTPLLQARAYAGLMETHSALGNEKEALHFLERTQSVVPGDYEADPNFSHTHFDAWSILMYEKDMYLNLGRVQDAWSTLERSHQLVEEGATPNRVDLTVKQAEASFLLGNLDQSSAFLHQAATGSITLGSQLLLDDTHDLYLKMKRRNRTRREFWSLRSCLKLFEKKVGLIAKHHRRAALPDAIASKKEENNVAFSSRGPGTARIEEATQGGRRGRKAG
jgi:tetratricopeptide (TPR) repeat protein